MVIDDEHSDRGHDAEPNAGRRRGGPGCGIRSTYTSGAFEDYATEDVEGLLKDGIEQARIDLDDALEMVRALCEPVKPSKGTLEYQH